MTKQKRYTQSILEGRVQVKDSKTNRLLYVENNFDDVRYEPNTFTVIEGTYNSANEGLSFASIEEAIKYIKFRCNH